MGNSHGGITLKQKKEIRVLEWALVIIGILLILDSCQNRRFFSQIDKQTELILGIIAIAIAAAVYYRKTLEKDYDNL